MSSRFSFRTLALFLLFTATVAAGPPQVTTFDVRAFGAKGDGTTLDTGAINKAIAAAGAAGGGTVRFPAGSYLATSIHLQSHVGLYLDHGATLIAAEHTLAKYDAPEPNPWDQYQDFGHSHWQNSLIWGDGVEDVSISGPGRIHGRGLWRENQVPEGGGNKAIALKNSRHVTIRDITILHGGHFAILATGVDGLTIDNIRIDTQRDGIDVDACKNVRISNVTVNSPLDDGICLKSSYALGSARPTENVTITNCQVSGYDEGTLLDGTYKRSSRSPTGRIKLGTESNGGFKNITISNCVFDFSRGLAIESVDGGIIEDVAVSNLTMREISGAPIFVRLGNRARGPNTPPVGVINRIRINNVVASGVSSGQGILIAGIPGHPIEDLTLSDVRVAYVGGGTAADAALEPQERENQYPEPNMFGRLPSYGLYARHAKTFGARNVAFSIDSPDARPAFWFEDVVGVDLDRMVVPPAPSGPRFILRGLTDFWLRNSPGLPDRRTAKIDRDVY